MNNTNTAFVNPAGDGGNKENDPHLPAVPPRPSRRNRPQQPVASAGYRLGPRIKLTKEDLDFAIYEDGTAQDIPEPRREYYGSNLPALPDITNGQMYNYALTHVLKRDYNELMYVALRTGDKVAMDVLIANEISYDSRRGFTRFLRWMVPLVREAGDSEGNAVMMAMDEVNTQIIMERFEELGLPNLTIEKANLSVFFTPCGEDRHVIYRCDFTVEEQRLIDLLWSEHWGLG
ncbi:hypothetical protein M441DRAFT_149437 [Trichoderma asperellum CBS 433.97]|uniref:Uncharacterized protein n=1 Tax=Trichoderma asperellum (strain ATCC 204424 / CBS 433.97 / NBRC 101777) TaxID=1042311 RepID=A0A2T3YX33_TRIA4|nr:hypothetical protein M441DRAFT_149437 [Trichoderma asperellum CBS 433.97]PTB37128.1 hypothetical protein M441DRAFT_149437 [Trichoderma asperellum CBS 433.97]